MPLQKEFNYSFWQHLQLLTRGDRHKNMYLLYAWLGKHFLSKIDERMALCCFVKQSSSSTIKKNTEGSSNHNFIFHNFLPVLYSCEILFPFFKNQSVTKFWSPKWLIIKWRRFWLRIIHMTLHYFYRLQ